MIPELSPPAAFGLLFLCPRSAHVAPRWGIIPPVEETAQLDLKANMGQRGAKIKRQK
jgi:hypothetical protein